MELYHMLSTARLVTGSTNVWFEGDPTANPWSCIRVADAVPGTLTVLAGRSVTMDEREAVRVKMADDYRACEESMGRDI